MENVKLVLDRLGEGEIQRVEKNLNQKGAAEVRSNELADGAYHAVLETGEGRVEPEPHQGQDGIRLVKDSAEHARIDVTTPESPEDTTPYRHDNYTHNPGEFKKEYEDKWTRDAAYTGEYVEDNTGLIQKLKNNRSVNNGNGGYPNAEGYVDAGSWNLQKFKNTTKLANLVDWIQPAVQHHNDIIEGNAFPSDDNDHMAASIELAVEEIHPDAEVEAGYLEQGGHGGVIVYSPLNNIEGDHHFHHVDTASGESAPVDQADELLDDQYYNPFIEGYHHDQGQFDYIDRKTTASQGLHTIIGTAKLPGLGGDEIRYTDGLLEDFYNNTVANNENADQILDDVRSSIDYAFNESDQTLVYGTADDVRVAEVGDGLFEDAWSSDAYLDVETVESRLESAAA
jgi:hypothetical protein